MHGSERDVIEVPHHALSPEALRGVIDEFITRAGTGYGTRERTIEEEIADVQRLLERGEAVIPFQTDAHTTNIIPKHGRRSLRMSSHRE